MNKISKAFKAGFMHYVCMRLRFRSTMLHEITTSITNPCSKQTCCQSHAG